MLIEDYNLLELTNVAKKLIGEFPKNKVFIFKAEMGMGKTTLIKQICENVFEIDTVADSPTFSIVNEYLASSGNQVFHFDFYRLEKQIEAVDIGFDEYLYSDSYCFIEWPQIVESILPESYVEVEIIAGSDNSKRCIRAEIVNNDY